MGEAKRKREAQNAPMVTYTDIVTGERMTARNAGDPFEFLAAMHERALADQRGERPAAAVPCQGCTACCHYKVVDFDPALEPAESLARLSYEPHEDGRVKLAKRADGACIHLGEGGCTVYADRPRPCRAYDCRVLALGSSAETFENGQRTPAWLFKPRTERGRIFIQAMRVLTAIAMRRDDYSGNIADAVKWAANNVEKTLEALKALKALPPAELNEALGFDLPGYGTGDHLKMMREFYGTIPERRGAIKGRGT